MNDNYRHKGMRRKMVEDLRRRGIRDERVLAAMESLPRHLFLEPAFEEWAYQNKAFPIGNEQTISQPFTVAFMTELLDVQQRDKILEIGTGSGYQAAILALLGARVYTVERHELLYRQARTLLDSLRPGNVRCFFRDGFKGLAEYAPFDKIIVTAGAEHLPDALPAQLRIDGILVIPLGKKVQKMTRIIRRSEETFEKEVSGRFRFVPFQDGLNEMEQP